MNSKFLDYTALIISIIGAVNWGLIGFFRFNLVTFLFGDMTWISWSVSSQPIRQDFFLF